MSKGAKKGYQSEEGDRGEGNGTLSWRSRTGGGAWVARARVRERYPAHLGSSHDQACAEKYMGLHWREREHRGEKDRSGRWWPSRAWVGRRVRRSCSPTS